MKINLNHFAACAALLLAGACQQIEDVQPEVILPKSLKVTALQDDITKSSFTGENRGEYATGWESDETIWLTEIFTGTPVAGGEDEVVIPYPAQSDPLSTEDIDNGKATFSFDLSSWDNPELSNYTSYKFQYIAGTYTIMSSFDENAILRLPAIMPEYQVIAPGRIINDPMVSEMIERDTRPEELSFRFARLGSIVKLTMTGLPPECPVIGGVWNTGDSFIASCGLAEGNWYYPSTGKYVVQTGNHYVQFRPERDNESNSLVKTDAEGKVTILLRTYAGEITDWFTLEVQVGQDNGEKYVKEVNLADTGKKLVFGESGITEFSVGMEQAPTYYCELSESELRLDVGQTHRLSVSQIQPEGTPVFWMSDNTDVATVDETGLVTAVTEGNASIWATVGDYSTYCNINVYPIQELLTGILLNTENLTLKPGETFQMTATAQPAGATFDGGLVWTSSDENVFRVSEDGLVTAVAPGSASLNVTCNDVVVSCSVTVSAPDLTGITLDYTSLSLNVGEQKQLVASPVPAAASLEGATWVSDNQLVATVIQDGTVTAKGAGAATITVTCNGIAATCVVTVSSYDPVKQPLTIETLENNTTITFSPTSAALKFECTFSMDDGQTWNAVSYGDDNKAYIAVSAAGTKVLLRSNAGSCKSTVILFDKDSYVYGNAMSAICGENFSTVTKLSYSNYGAFSYLFKGNTHLLNHPTADILLPATTLTGQAYYSMFEGCTSLTRAPELPATNAPSYCYASMFKGCTSLLKVPASIKAESLEQSACMSMFENCSSIVSAPEIDAVTYGSNSLASMFKACVKLERAPVLKAASLLNGCCNGIFWDCSSLNYIKCLATEFKFNSSMQGTQFFSYGVAASGTFVRSKDAAVYPESTGVPTGYNGWVVGPHGIPAGWTIIEE